MKVFNVLEGKKPEAPKQRNPVAAFAQRSGAGVHKDQNKKLTPIRKEKHKKKDMAYEEYAKGRPAQVKGKEPMPKKKAGRTDHPFHGRLVGEDDLTELDREKKAQTANNIFMRFGVKKPISTVAGQDADPYVVGYAGFANTPADVKFSDAKWKFYNLNKKEDFVNAIKKMMADKTFTAAGGVTIYVDSKGMLKKFPAYGDFIAMVSRMGGDKIRVEYKPDPEDDDSEKGAGKKRVKAKWANPRDEYDTPDPTTTRYFQVTSPRLMSMLRRNDRVMQYYRPNRNAFVMGQKDFNAFVQAFGSDDIKIVDKFREEVELDEVFPAVALLAPLVGSSVRIGGPRLLQGIGKMIMRNPGKFGIAAGVAYTYDTIMDMFPDIDPETLKMLKDYGLPAIAVVGMIYGGKKIYDRLKRKEEPGSVAETATAGGTSAGGVATVLEPSKRKKKTNLIRR